MSTQENVQIVREFFTSVGRGIDLHKGLDRLLPAYDDGDGVTAAFNLNLLERMNREFTRLAELGG